MDLGYTEVTFTGGAQSIQLTPINGSIYEGENIEITITILDENNNPTPFSDYISMDSNSVGSFTPSDSIEFDDESFRTVEFSHNIATVGRIEITAKDTATGGAELTSNTIYIDVLDSLTPSYIELSALPSSVEADDEDFSIVRAIIYDDSVPSEVVTNYNGTIYFSTTLDGSYFDYNSVELSSDDGGKCHVNLYSNASGDTNITAEGFDGPTTIYNQEPNPKVEFYSGAIGLIISSSKSPVIANGVDYTVITVVVIDENENIVSNYSGTINMIAGEGYFEGGNALTTLVFDEEGSRSINLYSENIFEGATITAKANYIDSGFTASVFTSVSFTQSQNPAIQLLEATIAAYDGFKTVTFEVEVTNANLPLDIIDISWSDTAADLNKIEIASPTTGLDYKEIFSGSAAYPGTIIGTTINPISKTLLIGNSIFQLTFDDNMNKEKINIVLTDVNEIEYIFPEITI